MLPLRLQLHASRQLAWVMLTAHGFTLVAILPATLNYPAVITIGVILLLGSNLAYTLRRYAWLQSKQSVVALNLAGKNTCQASLLSNDCLEYHIDDASSFVAPYLTVLSLKGARFFDRRTVVILPDSIDQEAFRQLRVWLRWK